MDRTPIRVLLVDDQPLMLDGLSQLIDAKEIGDTRFVVVGQVSSGEEALRAARHLSPDVVLMDVKMDGIDGIAATEAIKRDNKKIKVIVLTNYSDAGYLGKSIAVGADGYLLKDVPLENLLNAVVDVYHGNIIISQHVRDMLTEALSSGSGEHNDEDFDDGIIPMLKVREREILHLIARGLDNAQIAEELFLSGKTVRNYISQIYETIGVTNRAQAVLWVIEKGLGR